jgi:hypothetical protein
MKFTVRLDNNEQVVFDIRLFDGVDRDGINVYTCRVNNTTLYFECEANSEVWTVLDKAIIALNEFRKKEVR